MPISKRPSKAVVNWNLERHLQEQAARDRIYNARILGLVLNLVVETENLNDRNLDLETLVDLMNSDGGDEVAMNSVGQAMLDAHILVMKKRLVNAEICNFELRPNCKRSDNVILERMARKVEEWNSLNAELSKDRRLPPLEPVHPLEHA
jgi:hypothetical protein